MTQINVFIAFFAGLASFISPCILPVIPGFMAFISGRTSEILPSRTQTVISSILFVLGFSLVFALLGLLLSAALSSTSYILRTWLGWISGVIIIIFALQILGLINIQFLSMDHKIGVKKFNSRYITSFVFGAAFAVGWSPCVGAILGSVLALAVSQQAFAFALLLSYALGLGIPFLLVGLFTEEAMQLIRKSEKFLKYFNIIVGILLLMLGILVFTNNLNYAAYFLVPIK